MSAFNPDEARQLLADELSRLRRLSREQLLTYPSWAWHRRRVVGESGCVYSVEVMTGLDRREPDSDVLVHVRVGRRRLCLLWPRAEGFFGVEPSGQVY